MADISSVSENISNMMYLEITDNLTMNIIGKVCVIAGIVASICFICTLAWNYLRHALKRIFDNEDQIKFLSYMEIARGFLHIACIAIYPILAVAMTGTIETINRMSSPSYEHSQLLAERAEEYVSKISLSFEELEEQAMQKTAKGEVEANKDDQAAAKMQINNNPEDPDRPSASVEETNGETGISKLLRMLNPATWISLAIQALLTLLFSIIKMCISAIVAIIFKFFIIVGPLAFAFSILPALQRQLEIWFTTVLTTGFVFLTLNILDMITLGLFDYILSGDKNGDAVNPIYIITFNCVLLITYISAFWLTSKYIGKGDAGRVLSKMVAIGTSAAMLATGGSALSSGSNLTNIASAAGNSLSNKNN